MATSDSPLNVPNVTLAVARGAATPPPSGDPGTALFTDDFASGDLSKTQNDFTWANGGVNVNSAMSYVGVNSAELTYGPDAVGADSSRELIFNLGAEVSEVWVEYYWYIPSNFLHRSDSPSNNKLLQINFNGSTYQALTIEFVRQSDTTSYHRRFLSASENPDGSSNWPVSGQANVLDLIGPGAGYFIQTGAWNQIRVHFKSSTNGTTSDGLAEFYANGQLVRSLAWPFWKVSTAGKINGGYIMGWANSGYSDATSFRVDSAKFYTTDPGWV